MSRIAAVATAVPSHVVTQAEARAAFARGCAGREDLLRLLTVFDHSGVERRRFAFPPEYYLQGRGFEERNADFVKQALDLATRASAECLSRAGVKPRDVDHLYLVTTTGLATPSLDALLVPRLGLRSDVRRSPLFGLGCAGGAGALARAAAGGTPALVVSVEVCGQVFTPRALAPVDVVGAALFGDGAAAALVTVDAGPRIADSRSVLFEGTERVMGWNFTSDGMRLILSPEVPGIIQGPLKEEVVRFIAGRAIGYWILHPGGRRVIDAYRDAFGLGDRELEWTRRTLADGGNRSSASVLFTLADVMASGRPRAGERGLVCALGPGFATELVLLEW